MIRIDKNYKNETVFKSDKLTDSISAKNQKQDKKDYPFWALVNNLNFENLKTLKSNKLQVLLQDEVIDANSEEYFYYFYDKNTINSSTTLKSEFLNKYYENSRQIESSDYNLYKGLIIKKDEIENYNYDIICKTSDYDYFFIIFPIIELFYVDKEYNNENYIYLKHEAKNKFFLKYNNISDEEFMIFKNNFLDFTIFYGELQHYQDYIKLNKDTVLKNKKILLSVIDGMNNIIISKKDFILKLAQKTNNKEKYTVNFEDVKYFIFPNNNMYSTSNKVIKYYQSHLLDYSIYPYFNFFSILKDKSKKEDNIITGKFDIKQFSEDKHYFSESAANIFYDCEFYNKESVIAVFDFIIKELNKIFPNIDFQYNLILKNNIQNN